jgi:hypothetical protein
VGCWVGPVVVFVTSTNGVWSLGVDLLCGVAVHCRFGSVLLAGIVSCNRMQTNPHRNKSIASQPADRGEKNTIPGPIHRASLGWPADSISVLSVLTRSAQLWQCAKTRRQGYGGLIMQILCRILYYAGIFVGKRELGHSWSLYPRVYRWSESKYPVHPQYL